MLWGTRHIFWVAPMKAKILIYDIENMGIRGWAWGLYEQNILHVDHQQHMLCVSYKWLGEKKVHNLAIWDYKGYRKNKHDDSKLAKDFWEVINEADVLIGHNIKSFDNKMVNSMFMRHKLPPPSPYKSIDTRQIARTSGRFISNKLDDLGEEFKIGKKLKHEGFGLWIKSDDGDDQAQKRMVKYCNQDVLLTEKLYLELRPWITNHPSVSLLERKPDKCPKCGSGPIQRRGFRAHGTVSYKQQYQCMACKGWLLGRPVERTDTKYVS